MTVGENAWIIKLDLKGFFPNINQYKAYDRIMKLIRDRYKGNDIDELEYLIKLNCFCNPQFSAERRSDIKEWDNIPDYKSLFSKPYGTGAAIGFLFWQIMTNLYLSDLDKYCIKNVTPYYVRFVDDIVMITDNKEKVLNQIPIIRQMLKDLDVELHPKKFYCQPYWHGLEFLGYHIKPYRIVLNKKLKAKTIKASENNYKSVDKYISTLNSFLGMCKFGNNYNFIKHVLNNITRTDVHIDFEQLKVVKNNKPKIDLNFNNVIYVNYDYKRSFKQAKHSWKNYIKNRQSRIKQKSKSKDNAN